MRADLVAGLVLTALGLLMSIGENPSPEAVLIPLATLPVIWRRRAPVACAVAVTVGIVVTYGQPRCGATVPAVLLSSNRCCCRRLTSACRFRIRSARESRDSCVSGRFPAGFDDPGIGMPPRSHSRSFSMR